MGRGKSQKNLTIAKQLRFLMQRLGLSQEDVARSVGVSQPSVSKWLRGFPPTLASLHKLAAANGVNESYFLGELGPDPKRSGLIDLGFEGAPKILLTSEVSKENIKGGMKSEIDKLIDQVNRKLAGTPGGKAKLARALGVNPPRISEWLGGKKEPSGNHALLLQKWVKGEL